MTRQETKECIDKRIPTTAIAHGGAVDQGADVDEKRAVQTDQLVTGGNERLGGCCRGPAGGGRRGAG